MSLCVGDRLLSLSFRLRGQASLATPATPACRPLGGVSVLDDGGFAVSPLSGGTGVSAAIELLSGHLKGKMEVIMTGAPGFPGRGKREERRTLVDRAISFLSR